VSPRRRVVDPKLTSVMTTRGEDGHRHEATFDAEGNGRTDTVGGHFHFVEQLELRPAIAGGHTHELTSTRGLSR